MRTHLVTGAGSGIGQELADRLRERGDRVVRLTREVVDLSDTVAVARWAADFADDLETLDSLL
ncbi:MAG: SDR family NAD(P)-dependent oxidoreductase, partial [Nocardioidaceae bacterium]